MVRFDTMTYGSENECATHYTTAPPLQFKLRLRKFVNFVDKLIAVKVDVPIFGVPLHVIQVSCRTHCFVLDLTRSILRQQFATWVSTLMPIYADVLKQLRRVFLLSDRCGLYVGACLQISDRATGA